MPPWPEGDDVAYLHSKEQSAEYAAAAMAAMAKHGVPPTPENFAVWYNYCSGAMPDLVKAINVILGNAREFTAGINEQIHSQFFGFDCEGQLIRETSAKVEEAINQVIEFLGEASGSAERYGSRLADLSGKLTPSVAGNLAELRVVVAGMLQHTQQMAQQNRTLEDRLNNSTETIRELRENLEDVRREALTDGLTGVANRKYFDTMLREMAKQAMETGEPMALLMLDVDHFKRFNDSYGHQMGDQVLKLVARTLTHCVKGRDVVARYGGEEFSVILPATQLLNAVTVAEQIRKTVANKKIVKRSTGEDLGRITLSIGVASFEYGERLGELVARGDEALYMAKRTGRNKVVTQDEIGGDLAASA
jgi:diguanylate cyclase